MRALYYEGVKRLVLRDVPREPVGPGEVRVAVRAVGICGSDVHGYLGLTGRRTPPMIMGHEASGEIVGTGPDVDPGLRGKHVIIFPFEACHTCAACRKGFENICVSKKMFGVMNVDGAMRDEMVIPVRQALVIPDAVPLPYAAMAEPLAVALTAVKKADVKGKRVAVVGSGTIGAMCVLVAKQLGAESVCAIDISETRLDAIRNAGADRTFNTSSIGAKEILAETGAFDVAVEAVGLTPALETAAGLLGPRGELIVVGMSEHIIPFDVYSMITRELTVRFSFNYSREDFEEAAAMLPALTPALDRLPVLRVPLDRGAEYFEKLASGTDTWTKVILYGREDNDEQ